MTKMADKNKNKKIIIPLSLPKFLAEWLSTKNKNRSQYIREILKKYPELQNLQISGFKVTAVNLEEGLIAKDCRSRLIQYILFHEFLQEQRKKMPENQVEKFFHRGKWWKFGRAEEK